MRLKRNSKIKTRRRRLALDRLNTQKFIKLIKNEKPDIAVCIHFLPAEIICWLRAKNKIDTKQTIVVTDFDAHPMWLCHNFEHYFVALDETKVHLEKLGIPKEKLTVSGIPINPVFAEHKDKQEMREKHGLDKDKLTILVSAGGFGVGNIAHLLEALAEFETPSQIIAVCGRNEELKAELDKLANEKLNTSHVKFHPIGYTKQMDKFMSASDLIVGKPGGLTTSEALAKGLIFVVVNPIPGQEERNSDHLLEKGCAIKCNNLPVLAYNIDKLFADRERFEQLKANVQNRATSNSAGNIVGKILNL